MQKDRLIWQREPLGLVAIILALLFVVLHTLLTPPSLMSETDAIKLFDSIMRRERLQGERVIFSTENFACIVATGENIAGEHKEYVFYYVGFVLPLSEVTDGACKTTQSKKGQ